MPASRAFLFVSLLIALAVTGGCRTRPEGYTGSPVAASEREAEIQRLNDALERAERDNSRLGEELKQAQTKVVVAEGDKKSTTNQLQELLEGNPIEGFAKTKSGGVALSDDFAFAKGSAELNDSGKRSISQLASKINKDHPNATVIVEGHTDDVPMANKAHLEKYGDNWGLSAARAAAVVRALEKAGVAPKRIFGAFRGEHDPSGKHEKDASGKGNKADRRVEILVR